MKYLDAKARFDATLSDLVDSDLTCITSVPRVHALELLRITLTVQIGDAIDQAQNTALDRREVLQ